jgi:hypothetical protein
MDDREYEEWERIVFKQEREDDLNRIFGFKIWPGSEERDVQKQRNTTDSGNV